MHLCRSGKNSGANGYEVLNVFGLLERVRVSRVSRVAALLLFGFALPELLEGSE
jgi:hypothetical protein